MELLDMLYLNWYNLHTSPRVKACISGENLDTQAPAEFAATSPCRAGGPVAAPCTCWHLEIVSWRAMLRRCPSRMEASALWRTDHVATGQMVATGHGVSYPLVSSRGACRLFHCCPSCTGQRLCSSGGAVAMLITPPLARGGVVMRLPWGLRSCGHDVCPSWSSN